MIKLNNIKKYYQIGDNVVKALDGIDLEIAEKEFVAIVGPSGSGKSTLMNIIGCLDLATEGEYILNDIRIQDYNSNQLAQIRNKEIGFIFQQFNLLPNFTAYENVEISLRYAKVNKAARKSIIEKLLSDVGLQNRMDHKPNQLSGGQQQRVSIARALANDPSLILADEPTGALDSKTGQEVLELLKKLNSEGRTIIMITHDLNIANNAKRIITISDGKIVSDQKVR